VYDNRAGLPLNSKTSAIDYVLEPLRLQDRIAAPNCDAWLMPSKYSRNPAALPWPVAHFVSSVFVPILVSSRSLSTSVEPSKMAGVNESIGMATSIALFGFRVLPVMQRITFDPIS
jgi:hypothetical protein